MLAWQWKYHMIKKGSNTSQYWSASPLYVHVTTGTAKPLRSSGHVVLFPLQNCTLWYQWGSSAQELKLTSPLSRTNWSFNYWGLSLCVFVHLDPYFESKFQMTITFDCVHLPSFECACELCILCGLPTFLCRTKYVKKGNWLQPAKNFTVFNGKMSQCA